MKRSIWVGLFLFYCAVLLAATGDLQDPDCALEISAGSNGTIKFTCPEVFCDDAEVCKADSVVEGTTRIWTCTCGGLYSPYNPCEGVGYIDTVTNVWSFDCIRTTCPVPCTEFNWPPVAAPQRVCNC